MNKIDGKTKVLGLIGNPVEHTMSPFIHNLLAECMNINMVYVPFLVSADQLKEAIKGAVALNLLGNNITVPYKIDALPFIDVLDRKAEVIGAVNTIHYKDGKIFGYNTDAEGFLLSCHRAGVSFAGKTVAILGCGGASKAIATACAEEKVGKLYLVNRTLEKAKKLKNTLQSFYSSLEIEVMDYPQIVEKRSVDICIQTTSIGMYPNIETSPIEDVAFFRQLEWAIDAIYNPPETKFLKLAREQGVKNLNGLGMLYFQAIRAFEIWHELEIENSIIEDCYQSFYDYIYLDK